MRVSGMNSILADSEPLACVSYTVSVLKKIIILYKKKEGLKYRNE